MSMDLWYFFGPAATALWNLHDARAGESTEATEFDSDEYDSSAANLSRFLPLGWTLLDLSEQVACALDFSLHFADLLTAVIEVHPSGRFQRHNSNKRAKYIGRPKRALVMHGYGLESLLRGGNELIKYRLTPML